jgi:hypothetical protein
VLGIREVSLLNYADGGVDQVETATAVVSHIRRIQPDAVVTFGPEGAYGHPDHIAIPQFTTAATVGAADCGYRVDDGSQPDSLGPHRVAKLHYLAWRSHKWQAYQTAHVERGGQTDGERDCLDTREFETGFSYGKSVGAGFKVRKTVYTGGVRLGPRRDPAAGISENDLRSRNQGAGGIRHGAYQGSLIDLRQQQPRPGANKPPAILRDKVNIGLMACQWLKCRTPPEELLGPYQAWARPRLSPIRAVLTSLRHRGSVPK